MKEIFIIQLQNIWPLYKLLLYYYHFRMTPPLVTECLFTSFTLFKMAWINSWLEAVMRVSKYKNSLSFSWHRELHPLRGKDLNQTWTWRLWQTAQIIWSDKITLKVTFIHQPAAAASFGASIITQFHTEMGIMEIHVQFNVHENNTLCMLLLSFYQHVHMYCCYLYIFDCVFLFLDFPALHLLHLM